MATASYNSNAYSQRRAVLPVDDPSVATAADANPPAVGGVALMVKKGDIIDVGIDWSQWCAANDAKIKSSIFTVHADSPDSVVITAANGIDTTREHTVAIINTAANVAGNNVWLENVVVVEDRTTGTYNFPDRTLTRMLALLVVR